ncbi:hypothetical protein Hdeb2414_s0260g00850981 [Helianthus debilis subsp. tardiflorus]
MAELRQPFLWPHTPLHPLFSLDLHPHPLFAILKRTTTTTNRWWCGGATQRETERERLRGEKERENRRSKTRTAGRSIYPVVGVKRLAVQDIIRRVSSRRLVLLSNFVR